MKKRWLYLACLGGAAFIAIVVIVVISPALTSASAPIAGEVTAMQTITPYQLESMHLYLGAAPATAAINASQADQAFQAHGLADTTASILETVLATCSMTAQPVSVSLPWANRPCYVISLQPAPTPVATPLLASGGNETYTPTVQYALVDANSGVVFQEAASTTPPEAP